MRSVFPGAGNPRVFGVPLFLSGNLGIIRRPLPRSSVVLAHSALIEVTHPETRNQRKQGSIDVLDDENAYNRSGTLQRCPCIFRLLASAAEINSRRKPHVGCRKGVGFD